jgi:uncharacterized protein DUF6933
VVVLRATKKVLASLSAAWRGVVASDTALGDWYVNRLVVDRQPLLLVVSSRSLLSILVPARDVRALPSRLPVLVGTRLRRLGIARELIDAEVAAMDPVIVAVTQDRSVLGSMVDFAKAIPAYLPIEGWDMTTLPFIESRLAETPCRVSDRFDTAIFPDRATPELLAARWHAA